MADEEKTSVIIVGDNEFWYATFLVTNDQAGRDMVDSEIRRVKRGIEAGEYKHGKEPTRLIAFAVNQITSSTISNDQN